MERKEITFRTANPSDLSRLQEIRAAAFVPIFASFRAILGERIYEAAQRREDEAQEALLPEMFTPQSLWELFVAERDAQIVGFVSIRLERDTLCGEIGLNAVHPDFAGEGIGTQMYAFAVEQMRASGIKVATVATGGDPSHSPARRAYRKAGFDVEIPSVWMCREL